MDQFVGEIRLLPYTFAPQGWALCQGQLLAISQNTALFSLLGTTYGGNGTQTFGLPDLRGRATVGIGQGPGLQNYSPGQMLGTENITLTPPQLPTHNHGMSVNIPVSVGVGTNASPENSYFAKAPSEEYGAANNNGTMAANLFSGNTEPVGGNQSHENRMPFLVLNYCIALQGIFPQRQ